MPRDFSPIDGFKHEPNKVAVRIEDDGRSVFVMKDGSTVPDESEAFGKIRQHWTLTELVNLVASGSWQESQAQQQETPAEPVAPVTDEPR